ncbi:MAG: hypothetical protein HGA49_08025 [Eubacteriaceae bacterium]|nr:hypothetical protein [Eubacteriaceae bacterium]
MDIGDVAFRVEEYYKSYLQASKALKAIESFDKKERVLFFDELGSLTILVDSHNDKNLLEFMNQTLNPLIDYDIKHDSDLLKTLDYYLRYDSIRKTAETINLSLSGLKYRLNKIRDFGYNLQSLQERFDLQLAIKIYQITQ